MTMQTISRRRVIKPRIRSGPINACGALAVAFSVLGWKTWPASSDAVLEMTFSSMACACGLVLAARGITLLVRDYRLRRDLAISESISSDHGAARQSTLGERQARGMTDFRSGELLGFDDANNPVWRPQGSPFAVIEMPPGVGKTVSLVIGSILHRAMLGHSVVVPDVKNELAVMLGQGCRALGIEAWFCNPSRKYLDRTGDTQLNPYQSLIDAVYGDEDERKNAVKIAADYAALHYPLTGEEKNPYFAHGSRRAKFMAMGSQALLDPANCTPTALYSLIADPTKVLARCHEILSLEPGTPPDPFVAVLKTEAANLLHRAEHNEENFAAFLEGAGQRLIPFNPAGHLGNYGAGAIHNIKALRERPIVLFIMTPLSHMREFADFTSLLNHNIIAACKAKPEGHPVHIVGEEALNYRFHDLVSDLETMRQFGVTADFYIQSFAGLERQYGREAAAAIESYADVRIYAGLNSFARAKHVSDMLADETIRKQDASYQTSVHDIGLASREMARPLMKPDEVLSMAKDRAWLFVRGLRPTRLRLINYAQVAPWRDWVSNSPITGTRLRANSLLTVRYMQNGGRRG